MNSKICSLCGYTKAAKSKFCFNCSNKIENSILNKRTIKDMLDIWKTSERYSKEIRQQARKIAKQIPYKCKICGYEIFTEVCHIIPISDFPLTTMISEINSLDNLCRLCPNHHKELDLKLIKL